MVEPLDRFLNGQVEHATLHHADHLRIGFDLLQVYGFADSYHRFRSGLKAVAARAGNPSGYSETVTLAFLSLIAERSAAGCFGSFGDFVRGNPDLMDTTVLQRWYAPERLRSDIARRMLILPEAAR